MSASTVSAPTKKAPAQPILDGKKPRFEFLIVHAFVLLPMLALVAAVPLAWGWGLSWLDVGLAVGFYFLSGFGVTAGFHRYFTHRAFKANRGLRNALAIAGSLALQGDVLTWVADHRRHHAFTDKEGDPHSPWLFGTTRPRWRVVSGTRTWDGPSTGTGRTWPASRPTCWPIRTSLASPGSSRCGPW